MKKIILKLASITLVTALILPTLIIINTANAAFAPNPEQACFDVKDKGKVTAVIEEPLDFGSLKNDKDSTSVRDCIRISACSVRNDADGENKTIKNNSVSCVSYLIKSDKNVIDEVKKSVEEERKKFGKHNITFTPVQVFLASSGMDMLYFYIGAIYRWGASMIGIIAVLVIVISGIQISAAGGEQSAVTSAKTRITQSLIGIVILFLSGIILYTINPTFFTQ